MKDTMRRVHQLQYSWIHSSKLMLV